MVLVLKCCMSRTQTLSGNVGGLETQSSSPSNTIGEVERETASAKGKLSRNVLTVQRLLRYS